MESRAKWIWRHADLGRDPEYVLFRKSVFIDEAPSVLNLHITADSRYALHINGKVASRGPARSGDSVTYLDTVDIAPYLRAGENVLAVDAIHYPRDRHRANSFDSGPTSILSSSRGGLLVRGDERFASGAGYRCFHLDAYRFRKAVLAEYVGYMEDVEGERCPHGWREPGFDDSDWAPALEIAVDAPYTRGGLAGVWQLEPRPIPSPFERPAPFRRVTRAAGAAGDILAAGMTVPAGREAFVELDAGVYRTGFIRLDTAGGRGAEIKITYSESYGRDENGISYIKSDRGDWEQPGSYLLGDYDTYRPGGGPETYSPFYYRAFRFIRLDIRTGAEALTVRAADIAETGYPLEATTAFESASPVYNQMWGVSLRTLQCCMYETYMDCPYYEQMQYVMDTTLQAIYTYAVSGDRRLADKAIRDFYDSQLPSGLIPCNAPSRITQIIPLFTLFWIFMLHDHYRYFGDRELILDYWPGVEKVTRFFDRHLDERGLLGDTGFWQFVDWASEWDNGVPGNGEGSLIGSMVYVAALGKAADLAEAIDRPDAARAYRLTAGNLADQVERFGYHAGEGLYRDAVGADSFSQHGQMWAVLAGIAVGERAGQVMEKALTRQPMIRCSLCTHYYLFRALEKAGRYDRTEGLWKTWTDILQLGVTTWPEDPVNWRSDCHAWSAVPLYEFVACGLGVTPAAPGFTAVRIAPKMLWLGRCAGKVELADGPVRVDWEASGDRFTLHVRSRSSAPLTVELPDGSVRQWQGPGEWSDGCRLETQAPPTGAAAV